MNQSPHMHRSVLAVFPLSAMLAALVSLAVSVSVVNHVQLPFTASVPNAPRAIERAGTSTDDQQRERALTASVTAHSASEHNPTILRQASAGWESTTSEIVRHAASERADALGG